jgi:hypothetical protein
MSSRRHRHWGLRDQDEKQLPVPAGGGRSIHNDSLPSGSPYFATGEVSASFLPTRRPRPIGFLGLSFALPARPFRPQPEKRYPFGQINQPFGFLPFRSSKPLTPVLPIKQLLEALKDRFRQAKPVQLVRHVQSNQQLLRHGVVA